MNLIIPMAGIGSRLRPITPTTPKPLIKLAGRTIIDRIIGELYDNLEFESGEKIKKIAFILNKKTLLVENFLRQILNQKFDKNIKVFFFYQDKPEGTAHAIYCAKKLLKGRVLVVFSDTLFCLRTKVSAKELTEHDGAIFVKEVRDPSQYGVVKKNKQGLVTHFVEKPKKPISKLAIIGVYYFKQAEKLLVEIEKIIFKKILDKNEYQLTTALKALCEKGEKFKTIKVKDWLDCGNPKQLLITNKYLLKHKKYDFKVVENQNNYQKNKIIQPVYLGNNVDIKNCKIGPNVSIEDNVVIMNSIIKNAIIQKDTIIKNANFSKSIIGKNVVYDSKNKSVIIGPYSNFNNK